MSYLNPAPPNLNTTQLSVPQLSVGALVSQYVLDQLSAFPAVAYSVRLLTATYSGACMNVRRSSDNTAMDIGFVNGWLDTVTLLNFCGSGNGFVTKWYNQGSLGSSGDATQTTAASQPQIVASGVLETWNGQPAIYFGGSQRLSVSGGIGVTGNNPSFWNGVAQTPIASGSTQLGLIGSGSSANNSERTLTAIGATYYASTYGNDAVGGTVVANQAAILTANFTSSLITLYQNGSSVATHVPAMATTTTSFYLGDAPSNVAWNGYIFELTGGINASLSTADRTTLELNQAAAVGIPGVTQ